MAISFREIVFPPLHQFSVTAPGGAVIGIAGEENAGGSEILRLAAGLEKPLAGEIRAPLHRRLVGTGDELDFGPVELLLLDHALALRDAATRERAAVGIERLRRAGATILLTSHDEELLRRLSDEIWWITGGKLSGKGDPDEMLAAYRRHVAGRLRVSGESAASELNPSLRRGDGRARVLSIETLGQRGEPTMVWQSGEPVSVRVKVRFDRNVADPVIGIMIRTRIGFEVFGTNTELEKVKLGPCMAGDAVTVTFSFRCELCPREYTLTAASHDPDGVWHDWLEDAVAFSVTDCRYTAGVANLRTNVSWTIAREPA